MTYSRRRNRGVHYWRIRIDRRIATGRMIDQVPEDRWFDGVAVLEDYGVPEWLIVRVEECGCVWMEQLLLLRRRDLIRCEGINVRGASMLLWAVRRWCRGDPPNRPEWLDDFERRKTDCFARMLEEMCDVACDCD